MAGFAPQTATLCVAVVLYALLYGADALQSTRIAVASSASGEQKGARTRHWLDGLHVDSPHLVVDQSAMAADTPLASDADRPLETFTGQLVVEDQGNTFKDVLKVDSGSYPDAFHSNGTMPGAATNPFVKVVAQTAQYTEVQIADINNILSIYLLMFVPIAMAWAAVIQNGTVERHYLIILPVTLCAMIIGLDLVNQSLSVLMKSPMALTSIQAFSMVVVAGSWSLTEEMTNPKFNAKMLWPLARWSTVAILFTVYQVVNHLVSYYCSLSERTVFMNLCPLVSLVFELTLFPSKVSMQVSFNGKMALCGMAFGAVLFALQYPRFTFDGTMAAFALVILVIPYRLMQRWLLVECLELPVAALACYDGIFLVAPSSLLTVLNQDEFWASFGTWFSNPAILLMLVLSWITFIGNHVCNLMLLRVTSATATLVFTNLANFVVVFEGVVFFGDKVMQNPLVLVGIAVSLSSGVWYAVEMQPYRVVKPSAMSRVESKDQGVGDCSINSDHELEGEEEAMKG